MSLLLIHFHLDHDNWQKLACVFSTFTIGYRVHRAYVDIFLFDSDCLSFIASDKDSTGSPLFPDSRKGDLNHRVTSKQITNNTVKHNWKKRKKQTKPQKKYPGKVSFSCTFQIMRDQDCMGEGPGPTNVLCEYFHTHPVQD